MPAYATCLAAASTKFSTCYADCKDPEDDEGRCLLTFLADDEACRSDLSDEAREALDKC